MKLVKYNSNWADEMDIAGFAVMTNEAWEKSLKEWENHFDSNGEFEFNIGTNEDMVYDTFENLKEDFTVSNIEEVEARVLQELFKDDINSMGEYGFFPPLPSDLS